MDHIDEPVVGLAADCVAIVTSPFADRMIQKSLAASNESSRIR